MSKVQALFKITGTYGVGIETINAGCGKCNKSYPGKDLIEKEEELNGEIYKYRLSYSCPSCNDVILASDV